jgi:hypothetical protein
VPEFSAEISAGITQIATREVETQWAQLQIRAGSWLGDPSLRGASGIVSPLARTVVAPLDIVQTRRQLTTSTSHAPYSYATNAINNQPPKKITAKLIRQTEGGWRALWKGNLLNGLSGFGRYAVSGWGFQLAEQQRWFGPHQGM